MRTSIAVLAAATIGAVVMSELLVGSVEDVIDAWGVTELFVGVMLVPIIGNAAEALVGGPQRLPGPHGPEHQHIDRVVPADRAVHGAGAGDRGFRTGATIWN